MGSRGFSPSALFANGEEGGWYDPSKLSSMKQNSDGTVDAVVDSPVGYIEDQSGNGNTAIQATSDKRPTLRQAGSLYYLEFDGANDCLATSAIDFANINPKALHKNVPSALSFAVSNAAKKIGKILEIYWTIIGQILETYWKIIGKYIGKVLENIFG